MVEQPSTRVEDNTFSFNRDGHLAGDICSQLFNIVAAGADLVESTCFGLKHTFLYTFIFVL